MNKKIAIATLGCKVNQFESASFASSFAEAGCELVPFSSRGGHLRHQHLRGDRQGRPAVAPTHPPGAQDQSRSPPGDHRLLRPDGPPEHP